jgi:hypothetical protein
LTPVKRMVTAGLAGLAALTVLAAGCGSSVKVGEGFAPVTTTTLPAPTTTSTTVPPCAQPAVPAGVVETQLATPDSPSLAYSAGPGGPSVGHLKEQWGGPSTRPVMAEQSGWVELRLNTRPNGGTGWVPAQNVSLGTTPYRIVVSICNRSLTVFQGADAVYSAPVGVGQRQWPTPVGPTFVDAIVNTPRYQQYIYGPTVLILGVHSNVFTEFDGGDGTVAIHGYPSDPKSTEGVASSHGCVRASPKTIDAIDTIPLGSPVDIVA